MKSYCSHYRSPNALGGFPSVALFVPQTGSPIELSRLYSFGEGKQILLATFFSSQYINDINISIINSQ